MLRRTAVVPVVLTCLSAVALAAQSPTRAAAPVRARIAGMIYDSVAKRPLAEALVRIVRADNPAVGRSATTDVTGAFRFDTVPAGTWLATFLHPILDSLRLEPAVAQIIIAEPGAVELPFAVPSLRSIALRRCGPRLAAGDGMITGEVRDANTDAPVVGAWTTVEWPEWVLQARRLVTEIRRLSIRTDSLGRYALCGAPNGGSYRALAWSGADTTGAIEVALPESGYAIQDFVIGHTETISVRIDSASAATPTATVRRGRASVRGTITTIDGRGLAGAVVRVIGSGSQVRTAANGSFLIADAGNGTQTVEARAIGYSPSRTSVVLRDGDVMPVSMMMARQRVQLDTVRVMAGREIPPQVRAIERRWQSGVGTFLDARTVREKATIFLTDALRGLNGVSVFQVGGYGQKVMMRSPFNGAECEARLVVDGQVVPPGQVANISIDELAKPNEIAAIEVYPRANLVPPEFVTVEAGCGVVVLWTKRATGGVLPVSPKARTP